MQLTLNLCAKSAIGDDRTFFNDTTASERGCTGKVTRPFTFPSLYSRKQPPSVVTK